MENSIHFFGPFRKGNVTWLTRCAEALQSMTNIVEGPPLKEKLLSKALLSIIDIEKHSRMWVCKLTPFSIQSVGDMTKRELLNARSEIHSVTEMFSSLMAVLEFHSEAGEILYIFATNFCKIFWLRTAKKLLFLVFGANFEGIN